MSSFAQNAPNKESIVRIFLVFLRLGLTSFGGPIAHLGYFREEFVLRRKWLTDNSYADLVALCQFLPGPASSQVGLAIGLTKGGYAGAFAAWVGFTMPSAIVLMLFAIGVSREGSFVAPGLLHGLKIVAVAVVAQAVWGMGKKLCPDRARLAIMVITACVVLAFPSALGQIGAIVIAAVIGLVGFKSSAIIHQDALAITVRRQTGLLWLALFVLLLIVLPLLSALFPSHTLALIDTFYRAGSLVFGGGHVVLPLLQAEVIPSGWMSEDTFLAGYGAAQAVPGPLFTFAAFLGSAINQAPNGWIGGIISLIAIYLPSFLLIVGVMPFWERLRQNTAIKAALSGINAAVVGLLLAALYQPLWTSSILAPIDFALALIAFAALMFWRLPAWLVVLGCGVAGWLFL